MIAMLNGRIAAKTDQSLIIQVDGIGLEVSVPAPLIDRSGAVGEMIELFTRLVVRETDLSLYGFTSLGERELFDTLVALNGVGPRTALAVLSTFSPETLQAAISRDDVAALTRVPGIGGKTARRMVLDLKDKLGVSLDGWTTTPMQQGDADVINALTSLGYSLAEARGAAASIPPENQGLDERILAALRSLGGG